MAEYDDTIQEGAYGQDRGSATIPWLWKRQGIHALMSGAVTAAVLGIPTLFAVLAVGSEVPNIAIVGALVIGLYMGLGFVGLAFALVFIAYEVRESDKINDWAWPDFMGWKQGVPFGGVVGLSPLLALA